MKKTVFRLFIVFVMITTMVLAGFVSADDDEIKQKEKELEEINRKIKELDQSIEKNKNLQSKTNINIKNVQSSIKNLEAEIDRLSGEIKTTEKSIELKTDELKQAEIKIEEKKELLNDRLRVMYKNGTIGYLEVLFGAEDFTDLLSRIDMIQLVVEHDQNLVGYLKEQRDIIESHKKDLENKKSELETLTNSKISKQDEMTAALDNLVDYKAELAQDADALNEMEEEALKEANQMTKIIKNMKLAATYVGGTMTWPVPGKYSISSPFGNRVHPISKKMTFHTGIDVECGRKTQIVAANEGTIVYANWFAGYGKAIIIDHGGGMTTLYAHLDAINVSVGDKVSRGGNIALSGNTGYSTGPHLHFEVRKNGDYVDPLAYVKGK